MANQIVVSAGAKVRNLQDVIIGTSGVLSSVAFDVANGVPRLDVNGKILVSQLPNSVMEYKGTWNAATNTPTLVNGTGNQGDVYLCNVAGTVDFGAGPIAFVVGDQVIYSGSIWQRASGATGTVTSVAVTESGDSLNITGSPITTSGTINIGFNGTNLQYVNGAGNLTTFPTLITSIGLSMPSAFSVANSPLTANGTIAVTGAGIASQYIRGDGTLANFPTSGGGGSSVSYYLNGSINQGTIGGVTYYEMNKVPVIGAGTDFSRGSNGYIASFLTDANDPALLEIPAGNWNFETYLNASSGGGSPTFYIELYKYDGTTFTLIASNSAFPKLINDGTSIEAYFSALAVPQTSLTLTDRLAVRIYVTTAGRTITLHTENSHLCQVITTFSTGLTALNGLTAQVQYFQVGTSGTDFNISSATATHTFNLPTASATNRGALSSADWSTFNSKQGTVFATAPISIVSNNISITQASASVDGYLSSTDFNTFNNKISGLGTAGYITRYTGSGGTIGNSGLYDDGTQVALISRTLSGSSASFGSSVTATSFVKTGGTSAQFLKADGSVDSSTYLTTSSAASTYLPLAGGTLTGDLSIAYTTANLRLFLNNTTATTGRSWYFNSYSNGNLYVGNTTAGDIFNFSSTGAASFSSSVTAVAGTFSGSLRSTIGDLRSLGGASNSVASGAFMALVDNGTSYQVLQQLNASYGLDFWFFNGSWNKTITFTNAGAATFSSSVTAAGTIQTTNGNGLFTRTQVDLTLNSTSTSLYGRLLFQENAVDKGVIEYINSAFGGFRANKLELANAGGITFITQGNFTSPDMFITSDGNLLLGTTNNGSGAKLVFFSTTAAQQLKAAGTAPAITFSNTITSPTIGGVLGAATGANQFITGTASGDMVLANQFNTGALIFGTSNTERMRINANGKVGIGGTAGTNALLHVFGDVAIGDSQSGGDIRLYVSGATGTKLPALFNNTNGGTGSETIVLFQRTNGTVGSISSTNALTSYNVTSDYRLKQDLKDYNGLNLISKIKTYDYEWKMDNSRMYGVLAHELQEILPYAVHGEKDAKEMQGVDYSKLVPILIKSIQELKAEIETLKNK